MVFWKDSLDFTRIIKQGQDNTGNIGGGLSLGNDAARQSNL
jgi:hypothetical protein